MASISPRIQISPSLDVGNALRELSRLTKRPQSRVVAELLDEALPALTMMVEALSIAKKSPEAAKALMDDYSLRAVHSLTQEQIKFSDAIKKKPGRKPKGASGRTA